MKLPSWLRFPILAALVIIAYGRYRGEDYLSAFAYILCVIQYTTSPIEDWGHDNSVLGHPVAVSTILTGTNILALAGFLLTTFRMPYYAVPVLVISILASLAVVKQLLYAVPVDRGEDDDDVTETNEAFSAERRTGKG